MVSSKLDKSDFADRFDVAIGNYEALYKRKASAEDGVVLLVGSTHDHVLARLLALELEAIIAERAAYLALSKGRAQIDSDDQYFRNMDDAISTVCETISLVEAAAWFESKSRHH